MAFRGTGIQDEDAFAVTQGQNFVDIDRLGTASLYGSIAASTSKIADAAGNALAVKTQQALLGSKAELDSEITPEYMEKTREFIANRDPQGFKAWHEGKQQGGLAATPPPLVDHYRKRTNALFASGYNQVLAHTDAENNRHQRESMKTRLETAKRDILSLADAGQDTKAGIEAYKAIAQSGINTGLFTQELVDLQTAELTDLAQIKGTVRNVKSVYEDAIKNQDANPRATAFKYIEDNIIGGGAAALKPAQRQAAAAQARTEIRTIDALRKEDLMEVRAVAGEITKSIAQGVDIPKDQVDGVVSQLLEGGDFRRAVAVQAAYKNKTFEKAIVDPRSSIGESAANVSRVLGRLGGSVGSAVDVAAREAGVEPRYLHRIALLESAGNERAVTRSGTYKGLFQMSDEEFAKYGTGSIWNAQDNARAAARKMKVEIEDFRTRTGREPTPTEIYLQHQQGVAGLAAHQANPDAPAWQNMASTGEGQQKGAGWARLAITGNLPPEALARYGPNITSRQFIEVWRNRVQGREDEPGYIEDPGLAGAGLAALKKRVDTEWVDLKKKLDSGERPPAAVMRDFINAAQISHDGGRLLDEIQSRLAIYEEERRAARMTPAELAEEAADYKRRATLGELKEIESDYNQRLPKMQAEKEAGLKKDPILYTINAFSDRYRVPPPINWDNTEQAIEGLKVRTGVAKHAAANYQLATVSPLQGAELSAFTDRWANSTAEQKVKMLDALNRGMDGKHLAATMTAASIDPALKAAAGLYSENPDLGASIVRGQELSKTDPRYNMLTQARKSGDFTEKLDTAVPAVSFGGAGEAHSMIRNAIHMRYVDLSRNDTPDDKPNADRLTRAINDVTGGMVTHAGRPIPAPRRGMDQKSFDAVIANLNDRDLEGALFPQTGTPITAQQVRGATLGRGYRLTAYRDGQYLIDTSSDETNPQYAAVEKDGAIGPFVLDLRRIQPAQRQAAPPTENFP
jgi:hypothetical protein